MVTPRQVLQGAAVAAALALGAAAQTPAGQGQNPPPPQPQPAQQDPPPKPQPIDPAKAAAEILRQRLGLKPGPIGEPPRGPVPKPVEPKPVEPEPPPATSNPEAQGAAERQAGEQDPQGQQPAAGQDPKPTQPATVDPTEAAKRALEKLLPNAKPPEAAPIPTATGTPEPVADPTRPVVATEQLPTPKPIPTDSLRWGGIASARYRFRHG
ncbi:MAG: hypothetical protein RL398_3347, partial [Planctomycetota bacterium]